MIGVESFSMNPNYKSICCQHCQCKASSSSYQLSNSHLEVVHLQETLHKTQAELDDYRTLYENLPAIYINLDLSGIVLRVNQFGATQLGYTAQELIGHPVFHIFHPEDSSRLQAKFAALVQHSNQNMQQEYRLLGKDGEILWVKVNLLVVRKNIINPVILLICEKISNRKQAEETVPIVPEEQLQPQHYSAIQQRQPLEINLLQPLVTQATIAVQQSELFQQVQQFNTFLEQQVQERTTQLQQALRFEAMLKRITDKVRDSLDESHILQIAVQELALGLEVDCCDTAVCDLDRGTLTICFDYTTSSIISACGTTISITDLADIFPQMLQGQYVHFCEISPDPIRLIQKQTTILACPIFDDKGVLGDLWLFAQDGRVFSEMEIRLVQQVANQCAIAIRQARLYQAAQKQVEELERLNRLKDDFLSTVSHELRTPMANIKMAIHMLQIIMDWQSRSPSETGSKAESGKAARYFQILNDECERESSLINDLLDLQQLDAGNQPLEQTIIDLRDWIPHVVKPFEHIALNQQQILRIDIADNLPTLFSDTFSLGRMLTELLNNACKYTPPAETITVTARGSSGMILLRVSNSGVEIPERELLQIFDKFYRIPSNDPWKQSGTGLGLALVKKLAEHLGGRIRAESASGQTCFTIELPIQVK